MLHSENEIDRLFRNKLSHYEEDAPPYTWDKIVDRLEQKRKARLMWIYLSFAASVALIVSMGIGYYLGQVRGNNHITSTSQHAAVTLSHENIAENKKISTAEAKSYPAANMAVTVVARKQESDSLPAEQFSADTSPSTRVILAHTSPLPGYLTSRLGFCKTENQHHLLITEDKNSRQQEKSERLIFDRFYLSFTAAPLYSYRIVDGVQSLTLNKIEKPTVTFSAGMNAIFARQRVQLSLGLYFTQMAIRIDNVSIRSDNQYAKYALEKSQQSVALLNSSGSIHIDSHDMVISNSESVMAYQYPDQGVVQNGVEQYDKNSAGSGNIALGTSREDLTYLTQRFNYLEIPISMQYNIYQRHITVGLQTGIDANLLLSDAIYAKLDNRQSRIGETRNIKTFNVAGSLGISVSVPFTYRISFLIEPRFRYYLFSVNREVPIKTHPYSYGIYTGIMIRY